jgi:BMFP domain-containing protein YqiC
MLEKDGAPLWRTVLVHPCDGGVTGQGAYRRSTLRARLSESTGEKSVFDAKQLDELTDKVLNALPGGVREMQQDLEKNLHIALQSVLAKLDLVTREEFDVQSAVLLRTREKLTALEARVAELEKQLGDN